MNNFYIETRIQGNKQVWNVLKEACLTDAGISYFNLETAKLLIEESGFFCIKDSIQIVCDSRGHKHDLPIFVINEPSGYKEFEVTRIDENEETINIKARRAMHEDIQIEISNHKTIEELKKIISEKSSIKIEKIRLFFNGKELRDNIPMVNYSITNEMVITVFERQD